MWLVTYYEDQFRVDLAGSLVFFMEAVKRELNFEITKRMTYRAKVYAQEKVFGDQEKQYAKIRDYLQTLLNKNPRSIVVLTTITNPMPEENSNPLFNGMFLSFKSQIQGFLNGCRQIIGLDGCFAKLANGSQVLVASARDGNSNIFPLAFGVVNAEDTDNRTWFLEKLESTISQGEQHGGWTIMLDGQKGLLNEVRYEFPNCEHTFSKIHAIANFSHVGFRGVIYKEYFDVVVDAHTLNEYSISMKNLKACDVEAWKWVNGIPKEHINMHTFRKNCKKDRIVNNLSDMFNKYILEYKDKPIVTMSELLRTRLMTRTFLEQKVGVTAG